MGTKRNIEIQDHEGNIYNPHTAAKVVFLEDGKNVESQLTKMATDMESVKQSGVDAKQKVVTAINSKKTVPDITTAATWDTVATSINNIKEGTGNAQPGEVLAGKTFTNSNGEQTGTMPVRTFAATGGHVIATEARGSGTGALCFVPPEGYYKAEKNEGGFGILLAHSDHYIASNILSTANIFGVQGSIPVHGTVVNGLVAHGYGEGGFINARVPLGAYTTAYESTPGFFIAQCPDSNFTPANIKKGTTIFGLTGTYDAVSDYPPFLIKHNVWHSLREGYTFMPRAAMGKVNNNLFITGGVTSGGGTNYIDVYDLVLKEKTRLIETMVSKRYDHTCAVLNNKVYSACGNFDGADATKHNSVEYFDPALKVSHYVAASTTGTGKSSHASCVYDGLMWLSGGRYNNTSLTTFECYNPNTDTWTIKAPLIEGCSMHEMAVAGNEIHIVDYILNGMGDNHRIYNPISNTWRVGGITPKGMRNVMLAGIDDKLYLDCLSNGVVTSCTYTVSTGTWVTDREPIPCISTGEGKSVSAGKSYYTLSGENTVDLYCYVI